MKARRRRLAGCVASLFLAACAQPTPALLPTQASEITTLPSATTRATGTPTVVPPTFTPTGFPAATAQPQTPPVVAGGLKFRAPAQAASAWNTAVRFLESAAWETYPGEALSQAGQTYTYTIQLGWDEELIWANGWCAATRPQLEDEWAAIEITFSANGKPLTAELFATYEATGAQMVCRWRYAVVSGWPSGVTQLNTTVTFARAFTDEAHIYPAGMHTYQYQIEKP